MTSFARFLLGALFASVGPGLLACAPATDSPSAPPEQPASPAFVVSSPTDTGRRLQTISPVVGAAATFTGNAFVSEGFESADFETLDGQFSNERGAVHLFGEGLLQMLAREMTTDLQAERDKGIAQARATGQAVTIALSSKASISVRSSPAPTASSISTSSTASIPI